MTVSILILLPIAAALVCYFAGKYEEKRQGVSVKNILSIVFSAAEFAIAMYAVISAFNGSYAVLELSWFMGIGISFEINEFKALFVMLAVAIWLVTVIFCAGYFKDKKSSAKFYMFMFFTEAATMAVFMSADLLTTFTFFEIMSFTSWAFVNIDDTKKAREAASSYLTFAVIGGLVMLFGVIMLYYKTGTVNMAELEDAVKVYGHKKEIYIAGGCLLFGFGAKAGMFPLHTWLPKTYTNAPVPGTALLSSILTKTGIFGVIIITSKLFINDYKWGVAVLMLGTATMLIGGILGVFSINLIRTLACSSMSQIGFIFAGIGMMSILGEDNALAVRGALLHMFNHSLFKIALFTVAGVIAIHKSDLDLNEIRGFGRNKPVLKIVFIISGLGISGVPFLNGYISKTLIHESIVEYTNIAAGGTAYDMFKTVEWIFLISGGLTLAYMTKLYIAIFAEKPVISENNLKIKSAKTKAIKNESKKADNSYAGVPVKVILIILSCIMVILGTLPYFTMDKLADLAQGFLGVSKAEGVNYFSAANIEGAFISITIGILVYAVVVRLLLMRKTKNAAKIYIDAFPGWLSIEDEIYEPVLMHFMTFTGAFAARIFDRLVDGTVVLLKKTIYADSKPKKQFEVGTMGTYVAGTIADFFVRLLNKTVRRNRPIERKHSFVSGFAVGKTEASAAVQLIVKSVSFGLLFFALGLLCTMIYLIFVA